MKTSKIFKLILIIVTLAVLTAGYFSCKEFGIPEYEVTVVFDEGIEGTPPAGVNLYEDLSIVEYAYTTTDDRQSVEVLIEGTNWVPAGYFTVYGDMEVQVIRFDVRGSWNIQFMNEGGTEVMETYNMTFYGPDRLGGTVLDDRGYTGSWVKDGNKIDINFTNWADYHFVCGTVVNAQRILTLQGEWDGEGDTGWWSATRN